MDYSLRSEGNRLEVLMQGRFTFQDNEKLRQLLADIQGKRAPAIGIDMSGLEYIDSAGLGMLLLIRDAAEEAKASAIFHGAQGQAKKILGMCRFEDILTVRD